jgi:hypothetical protein
MSWGTPHSLVVVVEEGFDKLGRAIHDQVDLRIRDVISRREDDVVAIRTVNGSRTRIDVNAVLFGQTFCMLD